MSHNFREYCHQADRAGSTGDFIKLGKLLSLSDIHVKLTQVPENVEAECIRFVKAPTSDLVVLLLRCIKFLREGRIKDAFEAEAELVRIYTQLLKQQQGNSALPILYSIVVDLRRLAFKAGDKKPEEASNLLLQCFRNCTADNKSSIQDTKKWGLMSIVNQLFRIYQLLGNLKMLDALTRAIDSLPFRDSYPASQLVTYNYFAGKKAMFDANFEAANEMLSYAFHRCHRASRRNKRAVLYCLIPVRLLLGYMPRDSLLEKYNLPEFRELAAALRSGHLGRFRKVLHTHEKVFHERGIYLILEQLHTLVYRNLFKRVFLILKTHQLPIDAFTSALKMAGLVDADNEEAHCLLANLICNGRIRGYISWQHDTLVVSKVNAFPPLVQHER